MTRAALLLALVATSAVAADGPVGPRSPRDELGTFRLVPGFKAELVAAEPDVIDPVAMCFDHKGHLYVCEMRGYPNGGVGTGNETRGRVRRLTDRDGDGVFETSTVFADGLRFPMGVTPWRDGVLVAVAPDIVFLRDADGDGVAETKTVLYTGFNLANIQQMVNGLQWAADGWVYGIAGNAAGTITCPQKPDAPPVELRARGFRFHPDRPGSLEPTSGGGQYGITADEFGHWFTNTNSQHLRQIVVRDEYLRRNPNAQVLAVTVDVPDHGPACKVFRISPFEPWRVERTTRRAGGADARRFASTELVPGGFVTSGCSPLVYTADLFPPAYRGSVFSCDPANNLVHRDVLDASGPVFVAKRGEADCEFLASTDNWFRPVQVALGPDGAVYVLDFYREAIETPLSLPDDIKAKMNLESRGRGRVWRVTPTDAARKPVTLPDDPAAVAGLLTHPNSWVRLTAQRLLFQAKPPVADSIAALVAAAKGTPTLPVVLGTLAGYDRLTDDVLTAALADPLAGNREVALRLAEPRLAASTAVRAAAAKLAGDPAAMVRFQLGFSIGAAPEADRLPVLAALLARDGQDPWVQSAVLCSAGDRVSPLVAAVLKGGDTPAGRAFLARAATGAVGNPAELAAVVRQVPTAGPAGDALVEGLGQGMRGRKQTLTAWLAAPPADLAEPAAAISRRLSQAVTAAAAGDVAAVRLLAFAPFETALAPLGGLLTPQTAPDVQLAAVRSLSALAARPEVPRALLAGWKGYGPSVRREVVEQLLARPDRVAALLDAVERNEVRPNELDPSRVAQLRNSPNTAVRTRAAKLFAGATSADRRAVIEKYRSAAGLTGDPAKGQTVFKGQCAACHRLGADGYDVGPNLLAVVPGKSFDDLLTAVFDPNREVDPRYFNYQLATADGRTLTGLIVGETPNAVTLRRNDGAEDVVRRADIESLRSTGLSLMPEGLEKQIAPQDLADLFAYLRQTAGKQK
jgi:putative membrane-bound dehydrogenase-like protein